MSGVVSGVVKEIQVSDFISLVFSQLISLEAGRFLCGRELQFARMDLVVIHCNMNPNAYVQMSLFQK